MLFISKSKKGEEKLILLDHKIVSLDLNKLCEFALHAKVEKSAVQGKRKLSVIRANSDKKIEDSVEDLSDDYKIEYPDGLGAHLGLTPLKGMEDNYGQEELETIGDLKKLKEELGKLEYKQQQVVEKLAKMQKEELTDSVKD